MPAFATATAATGNAHAHALYWSGSISEEKAPAQGLPALLALGLALRLHLGAWRPAASA